MDGISARFQKMNNLLAFEDFKDQCDKCVSVSNPKISLAVKLFPENSVGLGDLQ